MLYLYIFNFRKPNQRMRLRQLKIRIPPTTKRPRGPKTRLRRPAMRMTRPAKHARRPMMRTRRPKTRLRQV